MRDQSKRVRNALYRHGVPGWRLADEEGICVRTLYYHLKRGLTRTEADHLIELIEVVLQKDGRLEKINGVTWYSKSRVSHTHTNPPIRQAAAEAGLKQYEIADLLGISPKKLSVKLRHELPVHQQDFIVSRIKEYQRKEVSV